MSSSSSSIIQFEPFHSHVDTAFFASLEHRKLHEYRLDQSERPLLAVYTAGGKYTQLSCRISIDSSSFNNDNSGTVFEALSYGILHNTNTLEEFKKINKQELIDKEANKIWNDISQGSWMRHPSESLCRFLLLSFADIKKHRFFYWFAFPAIVVPSPLSSSSSPSSSSSSSFTYQSSIVNIRSKFNDEQIDNIRIALDRWRGLTNNREQQSSQINSTREPFFLIYVHASNNNIEFHPISEYNSIRHKNDLKIIYFGCIDPGARPDHPGWPLRNYLLAITVTFRLSSIPVFCLREITSENDISNSIVFTAVAPEIDIDQRHVRGVGWEKDRNGKNRPRLADLGSVMDPANLARRSAALNLSLMKWRMFPKLDMDMLSSTRCLLIGAGTLGCHVSRNLMGWGIYNITLVDQGRVSYSNPVRQPLYTFQDCQDGGRYKAEAAAERLKEIYPLANTRGVVLSIPMPGHIISPNEQKEFRSNVEQMEKLIDEHDVVFLLTDSRESRWLPTMLCTKKRKLLINAALGFDSYVIMRHGMLPPETKSQPSQDPRLGCYFCSDIVAPGDSLRGRTLDQQCTVTRPGVSAIASALAVELLAALLHHPQQAYAKAESDNKEAPEDGGDEESALGLVPHQIRGFLFNYQNMHLNGKAFSQCTACSESILDKYDAEGVDFILEVCNTPGLLENITGLAELEKQMENLDVGFEAVDDNNDEKHDDDDDNDFEMI